jgi:hypothetical protein
VFPSFQNSSTKRRTSALFSSADISIPPLCQLQLGAFFPSQ